MSVFSALDVAMSEDFFSILVHIHFCNSWDRFGGQKSPLMFSKLVGGGGGGVPRKFVFVVPRSTFGENSLLPFYCGIASFYGNFETIPIIL